MSNWSWAAPPSLKWLDRMTCQKHMDTLIVTAFTWPHIGIAWWFPRVPCLDDLSLNRSCLLWNLFLIYSATNLYITQKALILLHPGTESCQVSQPDPARPVGTKKDSGPDEGSTICPSHIASWDKLNWTRTWWTGHAGMVETTTWRKLREIKE